MTPEKLNDFWDHGKVALDGHVDMICTHPDSLSEEQQGRLMSALRSVGCVGAQRQKYGPDFDFNQEVDAQLQAVTAMRERVMIGGQLREDVSIREVKETLSAATTLTAALIKNHEKIINFSRQQNLEAATIQAIDTLPEKEKEAFLTELKRRLATFD